MNPQDGWPLVAVFTEVLRAPRHTHAGRKSIGHLHESWRAARDSFVAKRRGAKLGGWERRRPKMGNAIIIVALGAVVLACEAWLRKRKRTEA